MSRAQSLVPTPSESKVSPIITVTYSTTVVPTAYEVTPSQLPNQEGARCPQWGWRDEPGDLVGTTQLEVGCIDQNPQTSDQARPGQDGQDRAQDPVQ